MISVQTRKSAARNNGIGVRQESNPQSSTAYSSVRYLPFKKNEDVETQRYCIMDEKEKFIENARKNARTISSEIDELSRIEVNSSDTFTKYRDKSQKVLDLFKSLKPLLNEDRENLWNSFQQVSNEHRKKQEERKKQRAYASTRKKDIVVSTIRDAKNYASGDLESLMKADELLKTANERMRPGWTDGFSTLDGFFHASDGKMSKEDLEYCWQLWNETREKINYRRKEIFSNNYHNINSKISSISDTAVYGDPYEALKAIKEVRGEVFSHPMSRENKDSLLKSLDEWWHKANVRIQEKKKEKEAKQKEWEQRKAERDRKQKEWETKKAERDIKQKEWEAKKAERDKKQREWEERKAENERKQREWEQRKIERERKQQEWEERQRERERKQIEWEERKLENERKHQEWENRKRSGGGGGGSRRNSGGGCYITTATCMTLGKPDDCLELTAIRRFRDSWLSKQKNGNKIINDYYHFAPLIVEAINNKENNQQIYCDIWNNYLLRFFELIQINQNKSAKVIYLKMVNDLISEHINLKSKIGK